MTARKVGRPKKSDVVFVSLDIGTINTAVAVRQSDGAISIIKDWHGDTPTQTIVAMETGDPNKLLFGRPARNYSAVHREHVVTVSKRARSLNVPLLVDKDGREWTGEQIETLFVKALLDHVVARTGKNVAGVLPTVPACFDDAQRRATVDIVEKAGYKVIGLINEPTGAILGYLAGKQAEGVYLVLDVGGGTSDCSAVRVEGGTRISVVATAGRDDLAGQEATLGVKAICDEEMAKRGITLKPEENMRDLVLLEAACDEAKCNLSSQERTYVTWRVGSELFDIEVTREQFEQAIAPVLDGISALVHEALEMGHLSPQDVSGVLLAGGSCRIPAIRRIAEDLFGADRVLTDVDPETAIVEGAAMSLGLKIQEAIASGDTELAKEAPEYALRPDQELTEILAEALGVRALNIRTGQEVLAVIVPAGTRLPFQVSKLFGLDADKPGSVNTTITVLQGRADMPADKATVLAQFTLQDVPTGPTKERIEISFSGDMSALVDVHARDTFSGKEVSGQANASGAITKGGI